MHFSDLPDDILLQIVLSLSIPDILSLKQTCRVLHAFASTDYLWHRLAESSGLLLNIPSHTPIAAFTADNLQRIVIDAIRLEVNWRKEAPRITGIIPVNVGSDAVFEHLHLVHGGKWMLVVQGRHRRFEERIRTKISFWSLSDRHARCTVDFELTGMYRASDVAMFDNQEAVTFVIALNDEDRDFFEVRTYPLNNGSDILSHSSVLPSATTRIELPTQTIPSHITSVTSLSISGHILAATVAIFAPNQNHISRVLLARTDHGTAQWLRTEPYKPVHPALIRLYRNRIIVFGHCSADYDAPEGLECHVYDLPSFITNDRSRAIMEYPVPDTLDNLEWGPLVSHTSCVSQSVRELYPEAWTVPQASENILAFLLQGDAAAYLLRFSLNSDSYLKRQHISPLAIPLRASTSVHLVGVGSSGRRAVWMEHNLDTTRSRMMKLDLVYEDAGSNACEKTLTGVLLPPMADPPLPFSIDACQALAFDEVSCRVCIGLWDGKLYLVDYV